ncbi:TRAP transporter small permease [Nocardioides campestrisoli]|uniref:TRAP transporter small permease n=1 Tax=Nocardioides campestrisoli TaxID=2736757 RepID=UPI0015E64A9F|nr:TRAP transporter small permease subunit [Nocardioides campestrisoli]
MSALGSRRLEKFLTVIAGVALFGLMIVTVAGAVARTVGSPISGSIELGTFWFMPIMVFAGICVAYSQREHIAADLIYVRMPRAIQREAVAVGSLLVWVFSLAACYFTFVEATEAMRVQRTSSSSWVPIWPLMFVAPVGLGLLCIQMAVDGLAVVRTGKTRKEGVA